METSWLGECLIKLIQWKYGTTIRIEDLQNLEYDPGGSLCKCFRTLTTYSNTVVLIAFSFAMVTASGQYVTNGVNPYSSNSTKLQPSLGTSVFVRENFAIMDATIASTVDIQHTSATPIPLKVRSDSTFGGFSSQISSFNFNPQHKHISNDSVDDNFLASKNLSSNSNANSSDLVADDFYEFSSTVTAIILSMNDSQIPRYSNRTPHSIEGDGDETTYFGALSVILGLMILLTIVGNVFVIAAILIEKNLQNVANYLIVSLAVADLMVACLVMPLGAVYEISEGWVLGPELCDMWTASDVLCCTASILHLVAIALDRYWAVTDVEYVTRRSAWRIVVMIIIIWTVALVVSIAPQFGWKDPGYLDRINLDKRCLVSQDIGYQIFATCATFYVPLLAILILYWKIFQAARRRIHKRALRNPAYGLNSTKNSSMAKKRFNFFKKNPKIKCDLETATSTNIALMDIPSSCSAAESSQENAAGRNADNHDCSNMDRISVDRALNSNCGGHDAPSTSKLLIETSMSTLLTKQIQKVKSKRDKKQSIEAKREKKAAKTLAIITGAFVVCWLPFFVMALVMPMCPSCHINRYVSSFFLWLGYFNSTLNPIIYTVFSPEFRQAFNRILCGIHNSGLRNR